MKGIKGKSSLAAFKDIVSHFTEWDWIGLGVVLVLICILCFLIWKRKYGKDAKLFEIPELTVPTKFNVDEVTPEAVTPAKEPELTAVQPVATALL